MKNNEKNLVVERANLYMGIGQAIQRLRQAQDELIRFGRSEEEQLGNGQGMLKEVVDYLNSGNLYYFQDLCTPKGE